MRNINLREIQIYNPMEGMIVNQQRTKLKDLYVTHLARKTITTGIHNRRPKAPTAGKLVQKRHRLTPVHGPSPTSNFGEPPPSPPVSLRPWLIDWLIDCLIDFWCPSWFCPRAATLSAIYCRHWSFVGLSKFAKRPIRLIDSCRSD